MKNKFLKNQENSNEDNLFIAAANWWDKLTVFKRLENKLEDKENKIELLELRISELEQ
jgi:hypothetical protein